MSSATAQWWAISPFYGGGTAVSMTTSSTAAAAITDTNGGRYFFAAVTSNAYVRFGTSSGMSAAAATTGNFDVFVPAAGMLVVTLPPGASHYRVISDNSGTLIWGKVGN